MIRRLEKKQKRCYPNGSFRNNTKWLRYKKVKKDVKGLDVVRSLWLSTDPSTSYSISMCPTLAFSWVGSGILFFSFVSAVYFCLPVCCSAIWADAHRIAYRRFFLLNGQMVMLIFRQFEGWWGLQPSTWRGYTNDWASHYEEITINQLNKGKYIRDSNAGLAVELSDDVLSHISCLNQIRSCQLKSYRAYLWCFQQTCVTPG